MKLKNRLIQTLIAAMVLSTTILAGQAKPDSDANYKESIVGQWKKEIVQGPATLKGLETFKRDGALIADGTLTLQGRKILIKLSGVWEIKNGVLIATVKKTNAPQMLPVGHVSRDKIVEINETVFRYKTEDGKLERKTRVPNLRNLNNTDEKKVPGVKPETIEVEIIQGLSASIKVSNGVRKMQDPALSTCFASPFYLAEIEIGELVWKQKISFARTNTGMVMIPKPGTEKQLPELLGLLNPEFALKTEEDGQAMLSPSRRFIQATSKAILSHAWKNGEIHGSSSLISSSKSSRGLRLKPMLMEKLLASPEVFALNLNFPHQWSGKSIRNKTSRTLINNRI